jgi:hypothetical protein
MTPREALIEAAVAEGGCTRSDVVAVLLALEAAGAVVQQWQPIESAPKQDVIILTNGGGLYQGFWQDGFGWITGHDDGVMHVRVMLQPTHWMPLLPAPALPSREETRERG